MHGLAFIITRNIRLTLAAVILGTYCVLSGCASLHKLTGNSANSLSGNDSGNNRNTALEHHPSAITEAESEAERVLRSDARALINPRRPRTASTGHHEQTDNGLPGAMSVWYHIRKSDGIAYRHNSRIRRERDWYLKHSNYLIRVFERAEPILPYIIQELEKRDMPTELALLPVVESAFNPYAYSRAHASGLWQFIPSTGKLYNMRQDWWYDGRRSIIESTDAALTYLSFLHKRHGNDWLLALAAYNAGTGKVGRSVARNKKYRKPADYWSLRLPEETQRYVPKLLALVDIVGNPVRYNVQLPHIDMTPKVARVHLGESIDLAIAAEYAGTDLETFYWLNAGFKRWTTGPGTDFEILIPYASKTDFQQKMAQLDHRARVQWAQYEVKRGDSLIKIARQHQVSTDQIRTANNIQGSHIRFGDVLRIPMARQATQAQIANPWQQNVEARAVRTQIHQVRRGESLWSIGKRHGVSASTLARWNNMNEDNVLSIGTQLKIRPKQTSSISTTLLAANTPNPSTATAAAKRVSYKVKPGDSLYRIARLFGVSVADITQWNTLDVNEYIKPGQRLKVYTR